MCLPAVIESDIAEVKVSEGDSSIHTVVVGHDGKKLLDDKFIWVEGGRTVKVYKMYGAQAMRVFTMEIDYDSYSIYAKYPVKVSDVVGLTVKHMTALVDHIMNSEYAASDVKKSKYGAVQEVLFEDKTLVDERTARHSKELEQALPVPELEYVPL